MKRILLVCLLFFGMSLPAQAMDLSPIANHPTLCGYAESVLESKAIMEQAFEHMHNCHTTNGQIAAMGSVIRAQEVYIGSMRRLDEQLARLVISEGKAGPASQTSLKQLERTVSYAMGIDFGKTVIRQQLRESNNTHVQITLFGSLMRISNEVIAQLQNSTVEYVMYFR